MERVNNAVFFALAVVLVVIGAKMFFKVADPYTRKVSASLADTLQSI